MRSSQGRLAQGRVITLLSVMTFAAFVIVNVFGWSDAAAYVAGFIPARVGHPALMDHAGLPFPAIPAWLTPLSATLVHGGWMHIGFNLLTLIYCGRQVELVLGPRLTLLLYAIGAYAAAAGQWALGPQEVVPMVGASGAISALIGAYALLYSNQQVRAVGPFSASVVRMLWLGAGWVFIQCLVALAGSSSAGASIGSTSLSQIAVGAHVGGFLAGMVLTRPLLRMRFRNGPRSVH
ncbi:rhomboid family intramembrane serine protease [Sphingobium subterraneum]|uniref:Membrane associated rhomboid family serine protease n=1 Tax=Sphingobium subterraneum TaxID=627688 RepID=A0A841IWB8_9SPHN|nr:rhomboid family intramembrane serine protease [Sphingobium subterraneum]MBB6122462.1 membrane associated rhomboid family serine protease [Sphingobium subterraneum]